MSKALLVLEDGTAFSGIACGASGETFGELCFNTSMIGYPEVISDPSYAGQIILMTYPQIGNYGVAREDLQRDTLSLRGLVVRDMCEEPSNFRSDLSLPELLLEQNIVAISEVDTRALTRHIRDKGAMRAGISTIDLDEESLLAKVKNTPSLEHQNLAQQVSVKERKPYSPVVEEPLLGQPTPSHVPSDQGEASSSTGKAEESSTVTLGKTEATTDSEGTAGKRYNVIAYDCGAKKGILQSLVHVGCELELVPWDTPAAEVLAGKPDGVFISNGPGDPEPVTETIAAVRELLGQVPLFGICLGHQIVGRAIGATTEKLKFGHHGGNHPVMNLTTGKVEITAQNHGFGIRFDTLGPLIPELSGGESEHKEDLRYWSEKGIAPVVTNAAQGRIQLTHVNLNDGTPEGIAFLDIPAFSVQFHPEASPGPSDAQDLFLNFTRLMDKGCTAQKEGRR